MKKEQFERRLDRFPFSRTGVSYFAEQASCEKRVELWLQNPSSLVSVPGFDWTKSLLHRGTSTNPSCPLKIQSQKGQDEG
jgi:hypothetical protein